MRRLRRTFLPFALLAAGCTQGPPQGSTPYQPTPAMMAVLEQRQAMNARDLSDLSVRRARDVPTMIDAARAMPNVHGLPAPYLAVPQISTLTATGAEGPLYVRLFRPALARNTPVILYFVGGTWATGALEAYEESARQLAARTGYIVVALRTRLAPETQFPGIHDDAFALYQWARANMRSWGGDPTRVALIGEGAGANLALSVAMQARDEAGQGGRTPVPDQLVLITPLLGTSTSSPSMSDSGDSRPLTRATVRWAQNRYASGHLRDPRIDLAARNDFAGLPPTTLVLAQIDPLRSQGEQVAAAMQAARVPVQVRLFPGTTHEFFALGATVPDAAAAEDFVATELKTAFYRPPPPPAPRPSRRPHRR